MLEALIARWGYLGVGLGTLLEGEATVLAAGALAHKGLLQLPWVWLAAFLGTLGADQAWFWLGRRFGGRFIAERPKLSAHSARIEGWLTRYGALYVVSVRFLYGLRTASVIWLGSSKYPYARFCMLDTLGALLWSGCMLAVGFGLGVTLKLLLGRVGHAHELLLIALGVGLAVLVWLHLRSRPRAGAEARQG